MDWYACARSFSRVVELGSFSRVAAAEGSKVSTVSRAIAALEADLGAALFNRSTRRLHLTEIGTQFHERVTRILAEIESARQDATALNATPRGRLRLSVPPGFGSRHVAPHLADFLLAHPDIHLDVAEEGIAADLIGSGTDLAIRIGTLPDSTLLGRRLAPERRLLVAGASVPARTTSIAHPSELADHECLVGTPSRACWRFRPVATPEAAPTEVLVGGRLRADDPALLLAAVRDGFGIGLLPSWLVSADLRAGRLVSLLPGWIAASGAGSDPAVWAVYPPKKVVPPKVKAFLSFLEARFGRVPYWDRDPGPGPGKTPSRREVSPGS
ncbi:MAG: LysR family transcriptional regulator [Gluconacetobacter diazotrophicus]|nr:LysR family transcriptional regulator [Gluconacetobacter diazotrophicus]